MTIFSYKQNYKQTKHNRKSENEKKKSTTKRQMIRRIFLLSQKFGLQREREVNIKFRQLTVNMLEMISITIGHGTKG